MAARDSHSLTRIVVRSQRMDGSRVSENQGSHPGGACSLKARKIPPPQDRPHILDAVRRFTRPCRRNEHVDKDGLISNARTEDLIVSQRTETRAEFADQLQRIKDQPREERDC